MSTSARKGAVITEIQQKITVSSRADVGIGPYAQSRSLMKKRVIRFINNCPAEPSAGRFVGYGLRGRAAFLSKPWIQSLFR